MATVSHFPLLLSCPEGKEWVDTLLDPRHLIETKEGVGNDGKQAEMGQTSSLLSPPSQCPLHLSVIVSSYTTGEKSGPVALSKVIYLFIIYLLVIVKALSSGSAQCHGQTLTAVQISFDHSSAKLIGIALLLNQTPEKLSSCTNCRVIFKKCSFSKPLNN